MLYDQFLTIENDTGDQLYACCPFHEEKTPSFTINVESQEWYCHGCSKGGAEVEFLVLYFDIPKDIAKYALKMYETKGEWPFPKEELIQAQHKHLLSRTSEVEILNSFGISNETIVKYQIGLEDIRITIPIKSRSGEWVNIRKYLPPHRRQDGGNNGKCINIRRLGSRRFYPYSAFEGQEVWLVEGEKDCLAAISQGYNAVTGTGGTAIPIEEIGLFVGKDVVLMLDTDNPGVRNRDAYIQLLKGIAKSIRVVALPTKDYSDFYEKFGAADVAEYTTTVETLEAAKQQEEAQDISLVRSEFTEQLNTWVKLNKMSVVGVEPKIYTVPTKLHVKCGGFNCDKPCALTMHKNNTMTVEVDTRNILQFVDASDKTQDSFAKKVVSCRYAYAEPADFVNVQKIVFQESASFIDGLEEASFENRYGLYMYTDYRLSATLKYNFEACRITDPSSQQSYYIIRHAESIAQIQPILPAEVLDYFRGAAAGATSYIELMEKHYERWGPALAIEGRLDLFTAIMLTYSSVTEIPWQAGIMKGWLDIMVIGDTRTGKSQMAQRFVKYLGLGSYINGENARRTGVIGGVQRFGDSWIVTWGAIPMNDRGLLMIDEASGLDIDDVKDLSSTRSSGAVTINKIVKGEARARTRLLWLSNPRSGRNISDFYWKGYGAFQEYIPVVEDQARYDIVLTAAREDIDELEGMDADSIPSLDNYAALFGMAWAIPSDNIKITNEFRSYVREKAKYVNEQFGGGPLVVGVAVHEKLLRLSCAFAILCGDIYDGELRLVHKHMDYAIAFLTDTLNKDSFGYGDYIREFKRAQFKKVENIAYIRALVTMYPALKILLSSSGFKGYQFQEILGIDRTDSSKIMADLITKGLLRPTSSATYIPDKMLMEIAKQMEV